MQFPVTIGLHRSFLAERILLAISLIAASVALAVPWPPIIGALLVLLVAGLGFLAWRGLQPSVSALRLDRDGSIGIRAVGADDFVDANLLPRATVHPWLTVCRLAVAVGHPHLLVLAPDSMDGEDYRRLRIFLRWRARFSVSGDSPGEPCS